MRRSVLIALSVLLAAAGVDTATTSADAGARPDPPAGDEAAAIAALEARVAQLEADLEADREAERDASATPRGVVLSLSGYADFGFFAAQGDGVGARPDLGNVRYPEFAGVVPGAWVFMGDPLATAINARGEPSSVGDSRSVTFDPVANRGAPSFIVNALGLNLQATIGEALSLHTLAELVPRSRDVAASDGLSLGDFIDVKLAYAQYDFAFEGVDLAVAVGKIDSVVGREYRGQEPDTRLGVTPSLACRYLCGRPLGVRARATFPELPVSFALALTNGAPMVEMFPLGSELDQNAAKTASGRAALKLPVLDGLELGVSGVFGAQDFQPDSGTLHLQWSADVRLEAGPVAVTAELVQGRAQGRTSPGGPRCDEAQCLSYLAGYVLLAVRVLDELVPYVRVDGRDSLHERGESFVYVTELVRVTGGLRAELGAHVVLKAEYTHVQSVGRAAEVPDDVFTSSWVVRF
jgi:hypothetical protein